MPQIMAYHPSLKVTGTDKTIKLKLDDWYDTNEILRKLGKIYGAKTVAELITKIKTTLPKQAAQEGLLSCEISNTQQSHSEAIPLTLAIQ